MATLLPAKELFTTGVALFSIMILIATRKILIHHAQGAFHPDTRRMQQLGSETRKKNMEEFGSVHVILIA